MSTIVTAACWPIQIPPTQKSVLISLADNANDQGVCWPALSTIEMRTCLARSTVIEAIKWLEAHGLVAANRVPGKSTRYQIIPNGLAPQLFDSTGNPSSYRTGPKGKPVQQVDGYGSRTRPAAGRNPSGSRTQPVQQPDPNRKEPSGTNLSPSASAGELNEPSGNSGEIVQAADQVGTFEGHGNGAFVAGEGVPTDAGRIAVELRQRGFAATSMDPDLRDALAEGVTFEQVVELADLHPPDPSYRNSPAYVLSIARRQRAAARTTTPVPRGTTHATDRPGHRGSASERVAQCIREAEQRDAAGAAAAHAVVADG